MACLPASVPPISRSSPVPEIISHLWGGAHIMCRGAAQFTRAAEGADGRAAAVADPQCPAQPFPEDMPDHLVQKYAEIFHEAVNSDPPRKCLISNCAAQAAEGVTLAVTDYRMPRPETPPHPEYRLVAADDRGGRGLLAVYGKPKATVGQKPMWETCAIVDFNESVFVLKVLGKVSKTNYMGHYATVQFEEGYWRLDAEPDDSGVFDESTKELRKKRVGSTAPRLPSSANEGGPAEPEDRRGLDPKRAKRQSHQFAE